jgi:hypothetical protein
MAFLLLAAASQRIAETGRDTRSRNGVSDILPPSLSLFYLPSYERF